MPAMRRGLLLIGRPNLMKATAPTKSRRPTKAPAPASEPVRTGRIHPVVIYPFKQPSHYSDLQALYDMLARLVAGSDQYMRPITVIDRKTHYSMSGNKDFQNFRTSTVGEYSDILDAWCV